MYIIPISPYISPVSISFSILFWNLILPYQGSPKIEASGFRLLQMVIVWREPGRYSICLSVGVYTRGSHWDSSGYIGVILE